MKSLKHFLMLGIFCLISIGAGAEVYSGSCGINAKWSLDTTTGLLSITGSGKMWDNYYSDTPWCNYRKDIISLSIGDQITSIGQYAFCDCSSLTSVTIPNSVTEIGSYAFRDCSGLTSVTIPNSVTWIGEYAFSDCDNVKELIYAEGIKTILQTGLTSITSVTIPNSVTSIGERAFEGCKGLTGLAIGNSVTSIGDYAFRYCSSLTSVTIPNSVTSIGSDAFSGCTSLPVENNLRYADTYLVEVVDKALSTYTIKEGTKWISGGAFYKCYNLTSVTIPNSVTEIGRIAFRYCSGLISVTIGNSVTSIGESAFSYCSGLTSVTIPNSVTSIGDYVFYECSSLTNPVYNNTIFAYMPTSYSGSYSIPDGITTIAGGAFEGCSGLTSVTIPNSVTSIGNYAFQGCDALENVIIGNSVTEIGYRAFLYCKGLTSLTIPNSVTEIGYEAFYHCYFQSDKFVNNSSLNAESNYYWGATICDIRTDDGLCIRDNKLVTYLGNSPSVTIPNSVTEIGGDAFRGCSGLTSVTIPNSVTSIGQNTFYGCSGLTSVTIPNSVTSIGYSAFEGCSGLTSVKVHWKRPLSIGSNVWNGVDKQKCTLYVPEGTWMMYCAAPAWMDFVNIEEFSDEPAEDVYLTIMGVNGVILQQAVEIGKTYKYLLDNKKNGKIVAVTFNGEDVTADVTDGKYTTPKITGNSEIYVEYDNQPLGDTNLDGTVNVNDITATAEIILLKAKAEIEAKAAMESIAEP